MPETVQPSRFAAGALERDVLAGLGIVVEQLDHALRFLHDADDHARLSAVGANAQLAQASARSYELVLACLAEPPSTVADLRTVAALLDVIPCVARMGDQCVIVITVAERLDRRRLDTDRLRRSIERLGELARSQVIRARRAFTYRDTDAVDQIVRRDVEIRRVTREIFDDVTGLRAEALRQQAMLAVVIARSLEQVAEGAVEIGEQAFLLVNGAFREIAGSTSWPGGAPS